MTWLTVWLHTLIGAHRWPRAVEPDRELLDAQAVQRQQQSRLEMLEREAESLRPSGEHARDR